MFRLLNNSAFEQKIWEKFYLLLKKSKLEQRVRPIGKTYKNIFGDVVEHTWCHIFWGSCSATLLNPLILSLLEIILLLFLLIFMHVTHTYLKYRDLDTNDFSAFYSAISSSKIPKCNNRNSTYFITEPFEVLSMKVRYGFC